MENKASTRPNDCKQVLQEVIGRNFVEDLAIYLPNRMETAARYKYHLDH